VFRGFKRHLHFETKLFCCDQNFIYNTDFGKIWPQKANKYFFQILVFVFTFSHLDETFCFYQNFIFTTVLIFPKNVDFRQKNWPQADKNDFFILFLLHIYPSRRNIFVSTKISYLQRFRDFMGDKKALQQKHHGRSEYPVRILLESSGFVYSRKDFRISGL